MSTIADHINRLFTTPSSVPQSVPLDLTIAWDRQPHYVTLTAQVSAATLVFTDAQTKLNWCESICDPHRSRWVTRDVSELEMMRAHQERAQIKSEFTASQYRLAELTAQQQELGAQIRKDLFRLRCASPLRRELVKHVDDLLDPVVRANTALFLYEQETKVLTGCEFSQDSQLYLREMLDPEQTGRPSQWRSFCKQEGM